MARFFNKTLEGPYQVELAVKVWRQLDLLTPDAVQRLQAGLERIARDASAGEGGSPGPETFQVRLEGLDVTYQLSRPRRTVTLLSVASVTPPVEE